jgi:serine-type D-Ala-D-Ala carboxypeptidase/endopeptidase (penicillin-binding protein 4)
VILVALLLPFIQADLDEVLDDPALKGAAISAIVLDSAGRELYSRNPDMRLVPASNQKIVTAAFALDALGPEFETKTLFWRAGNTVFVDAPGDPLMSYADLQKIKSNLKVNWRRTTVKVRSAYGPLYPAGWEWDDLPNKYAAPVCAFTVDRSSFELWTENGKFFFEPDGYGAKAERLAIPGDLKVEFDPRTMRAVVKGDLPPERARLDTLALGRPDLAAAGILGRKVQWVDDLPEPPEHVLVHVTKLSDILLEDLPSSDNNISENLLLITSGVKRSDLNPYALARTAETAFLVDKVGLRPEQFQIADGSGLSRHNTISARALASVLQWADMRPTKDLWHSCLAKPGQPGTLRTRLLEVPFEGKTGTMDLVSALCGYIHLKDGSSLAVAIMVNNQPANTAQTRDLIDAFIRKVLDHGNEGTLFAESHNHEVAHPDPRTGLAPSDWLRRSDHDGRHARARTDSGDESDHEGLYRTERVAFRGREGIDADRVLVRAR